MSNLCLKCGLCARAHKLLVAAKSVEKQFSMNVEIWVGVLDSATSKRVEVLFFFVRSMRVWRSANNSGDPTLQ